MDYQQLFESGGPAFYVVGLEPAALMPFRLHLIEQAPQATIRVIRGDKSTNEEAFFNEAGAALQFPEYFVELWDNFEECLNDLKWLPAGPILLLFSFAPFLLCDEEPSVFSELIEQLHRAGQLRHNPFKSLFQCAADDLPAFLDRLKATGPDFAVLTYNSL